ncbi:hypothetical protein [Paenibacillus eucommiae]|uniref:ATP-dependent protease HslVU (ClpYQ) ATPase subunit n=1 Tax=Paenibacillus eucommiae TaxID=1355755 RepID=A0ABS4JAL2_9BACL|nr:hypothetical protein [Paenibacillus eucommiae]MBP1996131.1 ATP-dependent protease HslVU (ClpYQ) ATPase subunit [Paenibacillus eucommiae]
MAISQPRARSFRAIRIGIITEEKLVSETDLLAAWKSGYEYAKEKAEKASRQKVSQSELDKDKARITDYYVELTKEAQKRSERKGLTNEKRLELLDKIHSIGLEQQKQLLEMEEKYSVRIETVLDHGRLVLAPLREYVDSITAKQKERKLTLHYNPMMKQFYAVSAG